MLQHGLDVASMSLALQRVLHPFITRCWRSTRDAKLKDALVLLLRVQLKLGAVQVILVTNHALKGACKPSVFCANYYSQ